MNAQVLISRQQVSAAIGDEKEKVPDLCFDLFGCTLHASKAFSLIFTPLPKATNQVWLTSSFSWVLCPMPMHRYPSRMLFSAH